MWETTLEVARQALVGVGPAQAWSLVSDSAAWSLRPGQFALDVPPSPGAGPLRCWLVPQSTGLAGSVLDLRQDLPGQALTLYSRATTPAGRQVFTLSVAPHDRGALIRLATAVTVPREDKADHQAFWRKDLKAWLTALTDTAQGRRPWPDPAAIASAAAGVPALTSPQGTTATVLIAAPAHAVWRAVRTPGYPASPPAPWTPVTAGLVPGTPPGQPGELAYVIAGHPDGRLAASLSVVRELTEGRTVITQRLEPPHYETRYRLEPAPGGTRLELTMCWPDAPVTDAGEQLRDHLVQSVHQAAIAYRAALEPGGAG
jgi:hypothetical protein